MSVSHLEKFTDSDKERLRTQILETFGALLMPHPGHGQALAAMTLADVWATPHRVIVMLDDCQPPPQQQHGGERPLLWSGELYNASYRSNWPDKITTSDLMFANETILGTSIRRNPQWIQVLQCQLTPSREDAATMPLNGGSRRAAAFTNAWYKAFFRRPVDGGCRLGDRLPSTCFFAQYACACPRSAPCVALITTPSSCTWTRSRTQPLRIGNIARYRLAVELTRTSSEPSSKGYCTVRGAIFASVSISC
jgi:hypothetical protein